MAAVIIVPCLVKGKKSGGLKTKLFTGFQIN